MTSPHPTLLVFQAGASPAASPLEQLVSDAQAAATLDLLARASESGAFSQAFLVTEQPSLAATATSQAANWPGQLSLTIVSGVAPGNKPFHFGETLHSICETHNLDRIVA